MAQQRVLGAAEVPPGRGQHSTAKRNVALSRRRGLAEARRWRLQLPVRRKVEFACWVKNWEADANNVFINF